MDVVKKITNSTPIKKRRVVGKLRKMSKVPERQKQGLKVKHGWWKNCLRKKRRDAITSEVKKMCQEFYFEEDISRVLPCKKDVLLDAMKQPV